MIDLAQALSRRRCSVINEGKLRIGSLVHATGNSEAPVVLGP